MTAKSRKKAKICSENRREYSFQGEGLTYNAFKLNTIKYRESKF